MTIPSDASKANCDSSLDDPELALTVDLAGVIDKLNTLLADLRTRNLDALATVATTDAANTFTEDQTIQSADPGAASGPLLILDRASASPAVSDIVGEIIFQGKDGGGGIATYGSIYSNIQDTTNGSEDGALVFRTAQAGTLAVAGFFQTGFVVGAPTGADKGAGTVNASAVYVNGNTVVGGAGQYDSGDQTITSAGALTLAHGLGVVPKMISCFLHCITGEAGYSAGDFLYIGHGTAAFDGGTAVTRGVSLKVDSTNVTVRFSSSTNVFAALNGSGVAAGLTNGNWQFVVRAYA